MGYPKITKLRIAYLIFTLFLYFNGLMFLHHRHLINHFVFNNTNVNDYSPTFYYVKEEDIFPTQPIVDYRERGPPKIIINAVSGLISEGPPNPLDACREYNCRLVTADSDNGETVLNRANAILDGGTFAFKKRLPKQLLVFVIQESPANFEMDAYARKGYYNATLTYRMDSDFPSPYGYIMRRREKIEPIHHAAQLRHKTKPVAWFVSNCMGSRREFVNNLAKQIPVDIFGDCGEKKCEDRAKDGSCDKMLDREYFFYLSLENSVCKDYISEKFWSRLRLFLIPIVFSRSIVAPFAPAESFIAVDDFESVSGLAAYMHSLINNPQLYLRHMKWRESYEAIYLDGQRHNAYERPFGLCALCKHLWSSNKIDDDDDARATIKNKVAFDTNEWYSVKAKCREILVHFKETKNKLAKR